MHQVSVAVTVHLGIAIEKMKVMRITKTKKERLMIMETIKVYCVVTTYPEMEIHESLAWKEGERVSQWYSRAGDAKRKSKSLNGRTPWTKAVSYTLSEMEDI